MKRRILLLMMTALLSVGAWAQSIVSTTVFSGSQEVSDGNPLVLEKAKLKGARVGSELVVTINAASAGTNIPLKGEPWTSAWANEGDTKVSILLPDHIISDINSESTPVQLLYNNNNYTVTKVTLSYNGVNLTSNFEANMYDNNNGAFQLKKSILTNASEGDILQVSVSSESFNGGWHMLSLTNGKGNFESMGEATEVYNAVPTSTEVTLEASNFSDITIGSLLTFNTTVDGLKAVSGETTLYDNMWWCPNQTVFVTDENINTIKANGIIVTVNKLKDDSDHDNTLTVKKANPNGTIAYWRTNDFSAGGTVNIPLTSALLGHASEGEGEGNLYLGGYGFTASSVDLIYKSAVNIAEMSNGNVVADMAKALESETVTLTVTPIANYQLNTLTVTDATGEAVSTSGSGNTYTFTMPATAVTVDATFIPTVPTALNTEDIKLTSSIRSNEGDGTVKLYIHGTETNGWDFTIGRPVSSTEFAGVEVKYKEAVNVQMVITYGDNSSKTQSFSAEVGSTNTAYITFDADKIVKSIKFGRVDTGNDGRIQFQSSSAVRLVGIVGASTYVPASSLTLTYETLEDGGGSSVEYDNTDSKQQFEIKSGVGHWAGWIFTLPIPTTLYKGVNFNMTSVPENGAIEITYEGGATQTVKLSEGNNIVNFVHGGNITQIKFNVAGTYRMGECSASNTYLAKVTGAKYATYGAVNDAIDYSATSGLKAYIAYVEAGVVKLTEVSKVPANTAVVLYAETAGTYTLSTATGTTGDVSDNQLQISDGTKEGDGSTYVLANGSNGVGFYLLTSGKKVLAGKAYLKVTVSGSRSFIGIGDDTTGIDEVSSKTEEVRSDYYDLQGRRVAQPTKGLYIVNGKKVIIK